jgi:hypothetical protein
MVGFKLGPASEPIVLAEDSDRQICQFGFGNLGMQNKSSSIEVLGIYPHPWRADSEKTSHGMISCSRSAAGRSAAATSSIEATVRNAELVVGFIRI